VETCCRRCRSLCVLASSRWTPAVAILNRQRPQRSRRRGPLGKSQVPGSVALATTGRRVSRSSFCGGERVVAGVAGVAARPFWSFPVWWRLGTPAAAASPQAKPRQAWLPRLAAHQHQRKTAGLPETLAEGPGCRPCASGALPRWFLPCVPQTEVDRKRYPDNLCEPPLVWSNFFKI
jgi:hypothetical protein